MKRFLLVPLLLLAACGTKSYTYGVAYSVEGTGQAEITVKDPATDALVVQQMELPIKRAEFLANGLGEAWVSVKASGTVTCELQVEKEAPVKASGNPAKCSFTITEDTDN